MALPNGILHLITGPVVANKLSTDIGLLILRLWAGGVMALAHGVPKAGKLSEDPIHFPYPLCIGTTLSLWGTVATELVGGILIALGLLTRQRPPGYYLLFWWWCLW